MNLQRIPTHQIHLVSNPSNNQKTKTQERLNIASSLMVLEFYHPQFTSFIIIAKFIVRVVIVKISKIIIIIAATAIQETSKNLYFFDLHQFLI